MPTHNQPSFSSRRRWKIGFDIFARTIFVLAVVLMLNYLGAQFSHRFYLSSQTRVGLASRSLSVLQSLTNHVTVTLYYDTKDEDNFYPEIVALLNEYRSANPKIAIQTVDYVRDAGEAEKIKEKYNLNGTEAKDLVIFDCAGRIKIVPGDGLVQTTLEQIPNEKEREFRRKPVAFNGEMTFTSILLALENPQPLKAYFLQGHGEPSLNDSGNFGYLKFATALAQNYIAVTNLELSGGSGVPLDCNLLIIAAPTESLPEPELQKIDQYLAQGGRLFALFNYASVERPTGLEPILQRWGVNVVADFVKDLNNTITGDDVAVRNFSQHPVVSSLAQFSLQMIRPRPIESVNWQNPPANPPQVTELAFSGSDSTLTGDSTAAPRSYPLIAAIEQKPVPGISNPRGNTRIIVAGDSIFLGNYYIEGGANRDFVGYTANWLLDRQQLLAGIGPRPVTEFRLMLTQTQQRQIRWLLIGALPGVILLFGGIIWLVRRK
jgi:ABC-2 type transport system permease protein